MSRHFMEARRSRTPLEAFLLALLSVSLVSALVFLVSSASSTIDWRGDFETGSLSQWNLQAKDPNRVAVQSNVLRQGRYGARFEVRPGDNNVFGSGSGERTEVSAGQTNSDGYAGREQWWAWSTLWDESFEASTSNAMWNYFLQFHNTGASGQASMALNSPPDNTVRLRVCNGNPDSATCRYFTADSNRQNGRWYDFVLHVKWSSDPNVGFVELWENGQRVVPFTKIATLYPNQGVYVKQGYYRSAHTKTALLYHDGLRRATSYEEAAAEFPSGSSTVTFGVTSSVAAGSTLAGTVVWKATPAGKTASSVAFSVDGSIVSTDTTSPFEISLDTTKLANAQHTFKVDATATDGSKAAATAMATVSNPVVTPLSVQQSLVEGQTLSGSYTWKATPAGKTASSVAFSVDGSIVSTDTTSPFEISLDTTKLANAQHTFKVDATATDGSKAAATAMATVSNPVVTPLSVQQSLVEGQTLSGSYTWKATPAGKTASSVAFSVDGSIVSTDTTSPFEISLDTTKLANAQHTFKVDATATDGSKAAATAMATVSNPVVTPLSVQQSLVEGQTLSGSYTWKATPAGKTASSVAFSVDGSIVSTDTTSPFEISLDTTKLANAQHTFKVDATATDGSKAAATAMATVSNPVVTPLSVQQSLVEGQTLSGSYTWKATPAGKTASSVAFSVDGSIVSTDTTSPFEISLDTTKLANAQHTFKVDATATDGSKAAATATAVVANGTSAFSVTQNVWDGVTLSGKYEWRAVPVDRDLVASSGRDVVKVSFFIDGKKVSTETHDPYVTSIDTANLPDSKHIFKVTASSAQTSASSSAEVIVANKAPSPSAALGATQSVVDRQTLSGSVPWTATPTGQSATKVEFFIDSKLMWVERYAPWVYNGDGNTLDTRTLGDGSHVLEVRAYAADGSTAKATATVSVSNRSTSTGTTSTSSTSSTSSGSTTPSSDSSTSSGTTQTPDLVSSIRDGQTLSGLVSWTVDPSGFSVSRMEFLIDSKLMWVERYAPWVCNGDGNTLDTRTLGDGSHVLEVRAYAADGSTAKATATVSVSNRSTSTGTTSTSSTSSTSSGSTTPSSDSSTSSGTTQTPDLVSSIRDGQTLSGLVSWTVDPSGFSVSRMEFLIDSKLMWVERYAPWVYNGDGKTLDSQALARGTHAFEVRATGTDGVVRTLRLQVIVA